MQKYRKFIDEPTMSDKTLLVSVEDLINTAFGGFEQNVVNFKIIQTVLHILARQMRLLEQEVEIKFDEIGIEKKEAYEGTGYEEDQTSSSVSKDQEAGEEGRDTKGERREKGERRGEREGKGGGKEGAQDKRGDKASAKDRDDKKGSKDREKKDKGGSKERRGDEGGSKEKGGDKGSPTRGSKERGGEKVRKEKDKGKKGDRGTDADGGERDGGRGGDRSKDRSGERGGERDGRGGRGGRERGAEGKKGTPESGRSGAGTRGRSAGREGSHTSITVTETARKGGRGAQDKVLVVGKGPASRPGGHVARVGSIEVVTASQFALLEKAVKQLERVTGPLPMPLLPDNEQLRQDLARGTASLSETMQALQLNARVQAAEQGLTRMAGLLTQLAAAGVLPEDMVERIGEMHAELQQAAKAVADIVGTEPGGVRTGRAGTGMGPGGAGTGPGGAGTGPGGAGTGPEGAGMGYGTAFGSGMGGVGTDGGGRKSVAIDPISASSRPESMKRGEASTTTSRASTAIAGRASDVSRISAAAGPGLMGGVTHPEMEDVLQILKDELVKQISALTARATHSADVASNTSKSVADKLDIALKMDQRISNLYSQTTDYMEQLSGFDSGVTTQMASFQEQMSQMRNDLTGGIAMLEQANNNAETAAIVDLTERYDGLVIELDNTLHLHQGLTALQKQLSDELRSLVECVEMLREQKADRDEVLDGLRDKADITHLAGLLHEKDFAHARADLENRLVQCYEKFKRQDEVWLRALKDLSETTESKAEIIQLLCLKDNATQELKNIQATLRQLYIMLGEPKAAMLMRQLAKGAACGSCLIPALMEPNEVDYGKPFALPELRPPPLGEEGPCQTTLKPLPPPDSRQHVCRRWVGGSHTLMADNVTRERAGVTHLQTIPTKRYTGYGIDGRLYMLEEELQPCVECNKLSTDEPEASTPVPTPTGGGGDQASAPPAPIEEEGDEKGTENK